MNNPWSGPPRTPKASRLGLWLWIGVLAGLGVLLVILTQLFPGTVSSGSDKASIAQLVAIFALVSSGLLAIRQIDLKQTAKNILLWLAVILILLLGYSYQNDLQNVFNRLRSNLIPGYPIETAAGEMVISESDGGSYLVYGTVNGARILFLIDTGASNIVLSPADATRAGLDLASLTFDRRTETANGTGFVAGARADQLTVGKLELRDVAVSVNKADMRTSLLGMDFLTRLKSFHFGSRQLTLRW